VWKNYDSGLDYRIRWDYIHNWGYRIRLEVLQTPPSKERNKMETVTVIKKEPTCAELVEEQWQQRQEDLKDPEYEALGFDYVAPHTWDNQPEGYWRWQFSWGGPSDELRGYVNEHGELHRLEYWYLDWGDGAYVQVSSARRAWGQMQGMIECSIS
jgi:hypothetical protein